MKQNIKPQLTDEEFEYCLSLEKQWQQSKVRLSPQEELEVFQVSPGLLKAKVREWNDELDIQEKNIAAWLKKIRERELDEFTAWFQREWVKVSEGRQLLVAKRHIKRLQHLLYLVERRNKASKEDDFQRKLDHARQVPLEQLLSPYTQLKRRGRVFIASCPLHSEKTPSFTVFPDQNRAWCFGCNQGGDVIAMTRLLLGSSFREAVEYLNNY